MRTLLLDTGRLAGALYLREPFRRLERDGHAVTTGDGEPLLLGRLVVPGVSKSTFGQPNAGEVRIKAAGRDPGVPAGPVALSGRCTITSWSTGGRQRKSEVTVTPERIEAAPAGATLAMTGLLPVALPLGPSDYPVVLGQQKTQAGTWAVVIAMPASAVEGTATIDSQVSVAHLVGRPALPVLEARVVVPDIEDLGRSTKSELSLVATSWSEPAATAPNAREVKASGSEAAA